MSKLNKWFEKKSNLNLAVDLGTENTLIHDKDGIILNEPSLIVVGEDGKDIATGHRAKQMMGRLPPKYRCVSPLENGVITDFDMCEQMLSRFLQASISATFLKPRMVFCMPSGVTKVEQRAVPSPNKFCCH